LILCKEFVEKNSGEIWVESTEGEGSKFNFSLPVP
jgi:signal transduction histidine kinase